jgi:hypothetical protein
MTPTLSITKEGFVTANATDIIPNSFNNCSLSFKRTDVNTPGAWQAFKTAQFGNPFPITAQIPGLEDGVSYDVAFNGTLAWGETTLGGSSWSIGATFVKGVSGSGAAVNLLTAQATKQGKKK